MKQMCCSLFIFILSFHLASSTKFILLGSLGDLAKKYLWDAIQENSQLNIEIFGASRNSEFEGKTLLKEILDELPNDHDPLGRLEDKFSFLLQNIPGGDEIISQSKDTISQLFKKLDVVGSNFHENLNSMFKKVPKTSEEVKVNLAKIFKTLSYTNKNVLLNDQGTFSKVIGGVKKFMNGFIDTGTKSSDKIMSTISVFLKNSQNQISDIANSLENLNYKMRPFNQKVKYLQLKSGLHYKKFCSDISNEQLIFYLSIPPAAYISTSELISKYCRKSGNRVTVAYEKPFGYNLNSAKQLFSSLGDLIGIENVFLIDHYLGKSITQQILVLRHSDHNLEAHLNNNHVSTININLLEEDDCEHRTGYYGDSGVFRDMLQNHATELLTLITADITNPNFVSAKRDLLQSLTVPNKHQTVVAQYTGYNEHASKTSSTLTYASVLLTSTLPRWTEVPFILASGKSQHSSRKDIVVQFKQGGRLIFDFITAEILYNGRSLLPEDFIASKNVYSILIKDVINGNKSFFPDIETVLASWTVWDHIINLEHNILLQPDHKSMAVELHGKFLLARNTIQDTTSSEHLQFFNKALLVTHHEEHLYEHLVEDIIRVVQLKISDSDEFHLAFSGGSTILGVYKYLLVHKERIPWNKVHIWQVDERCELDHINARDLQYHLLENIDEINKSNIHLMPVNSDGCDDISKYQDEFDNINLLKKFDYVVLGLGADGHTASLFDNAKTLSSTFDFSHIWSENVISPQRMTVTFDLINRSNWVSIIVTGSQKRDVVKGIRQGLVYPVSNVSNPQLTWFIDEILL